MKKVLALALAVVLAFGMAAVGFAATPGDKADGIGSLTLGYSWSSNVSTGTGSDDYIDLGTINPQDKAEVYLYLNDAHISGLAASVVTNTDGTTTTYTDSYITSNMLTNVGVTCRKTKGYPAIDSVAIKYKGGTSANAWVRVKFIEEMVSVNDEDFEYDVELTWKKTKKSDSRVTISGTIENPITEVYDDNDSVDTLDGTVAHAQEFVKGIECWAGSGVYVTTNMFDDCKYFIKASMDLTAADLDLMEKNVPIEGIITMKTALSKNATLRSAVVTMDLDDTYYVYDSKELLGISTDKLPFRDKYYLTTSKIDMAGTPEVVDDGGDAAPVDPANPITGGDDGLSNVNDNPGTGVNGFVNVAVVAGVVALAAAGAVCLKK